MAQGFPGDVVATPDFYLRRQAEGNSAVGTVITPQGICPTLFATAIQLG
jgi:hypothetical protein